MKEINQIKPIRVCIFARVSTALTQDYTRQVIELRRYAEKQGYQVAKEIYITISGTKTRQQRPDILELLQAAKNREFDKVLCSEVSRLGRNAVDVKATIASLHELRIPIVFYSLGCIESLDNNGIESFVTNVILSIYAELSQEERRILVERTKSGLMAAKAKGKVLGRRPNTKEPASKIFKKYPKAVKYLNEGRSFPEVAKLCGLSFNTVVKVHSLIQQSL
jgi:DNA invertase Pin-like site-specific DNA recombinase